MLLFLTEHAPNIVSNGDKQYRRAILFAKTNGHTGVVTLLESMYAEACKNKSVAILSSLDEVGGY
jgi:hypothetical protein